MQHSSTTSSLLDVEADPAKFTSFGPPPPSSNVESTGTGKRFGSFFGAVASAFRRGHDESGARKKDAGAPLQQHGKSQPESEQPREVANSVSSSVSSDTLPTAATSGHEQRRKFAAFIKKDAPVILNAKWASDDACHHCYACSLKFTTFLRRHHCRFCGRIFCGSCSAFRIPGQPFGAREGLRSCEVCYRETLRSLLETHYESLSEDMLQKINSLYAVFADNNQSYLHHTQSSNTMTTPTIHGGNNPSVSGSASIMNRARVATEASSQPGPTFANIIPSTPTVTSPMVDDSSVIVDPLRRRMTMDEVIVDDSFGESADEDDMITKQQSRNNEALPQFLNLKQIFETAFQPNAGLKFETRRSLSKTFYHCFSGGNFLTWLMMRDQELNSFQAAAIAKAMLDLGIIVPLQKTVNKEIFALASYYRPGRAAGFLPITEQTIDNSSDKQILSKQKSNSVQSNSSRKNTTTSNNANNPKSSTFGVASAATATKTNQMNVALDAAVGESLQKIFLMRENADKVLPYRASDVEASLRRLYKVHLSRLCTNLLDIDEVDAEKWQKNLLQIVYHVVRIVKPRPRDFSNAIDIRRCVKIKKIFDSSLSAHFEYVDGLVFTKSLVHRMMRTSLHNPRFLLLQTGLDFERDCQQLTTLDVVVHQEAEQMQRNVAQIASIKPTILFCGGSIPILASQHLVANEITAASFVKHHILEWVSRYTGAAILPSVDSLSISGTSQQSTVRLGTCQNFSSFSVHMHSRLQKTFLCLSGCDPIGCTLLIRDGSYSDLIKVKRILKLLISAAYDGLVLSQYLVAVRANPQSFDLQPPYCSVNDDKFTSRLTTFANDSKTPPQGRRKTVSTSLHHKRSKSASKNLAFFDRKSVDAKTDSLFDVLDLAVLSKELTNSTMSHLDAAFSLACSGLLSLSPLLCLPDPVKKSALFEASQSRIYFESPLFSNFASSYVQGKQPLAISIPGPPMWTSRSVSKMYDAFVTTPLIHGFKSQEFQSLLAGFCRQGSLFDIADDDPTAAHVTLKNSSSVASAAEKKNNPDVGSMRCGAWVKPLSIFDCQCLHVLTSTFSLDSLLSPFRHCDGPRLVSCPFHARSDLSLGAFLENQCFVPATTICPKRGCGAPLADHVRRFSSNYGQVEIVVRPLAEPILSILKLATPPSADVLTDSNPEFAESSLISWSMCHICRCVTPFAEVSDGVWGMSLASFLHLKFYGIDFSCTPSTAEGSVCKHSFGKNYMQFFAKTSLVAVVKFSSIRVHDLVIPPPTVMLESKQTTEFKERHAALMKDHELIASAILSHFDNVQAFLENCRINLLYVPGTTNAISQPALDLLIHSEDQFVNERKVIHAKMSALDLAITDPIWQEASSTAIIRTTERIVFELFQSVTQSWLDWNERLRNVVRFFRTYSSSSVTNQDVSEQVPPQTPLATSFAGITSPAAINDSINNNNEPASTVDVATMKEPQVFSPSVDPPADPPSSTQLQRPSSTAMLPPSSSSKPLGKVFEFLADSEVFKNSLFKTKLKLPLKAPFDASSHFAFRSQAVAVAVYDNEPSSLIAFALSTDDYKQKLQQLMATTPLSPSANNNSSLIISRVTRQEKFDNVDGENFATNNSSIPLGQTDDDGLDSDNNEDELEQEDLTVKGENDEDDDNSAIEFGSTLDPIDTISLRGVRPKIASRKPVLDSARFIATKSNSSSIESSPILERNKNFLAPQTVTVSINSNNSNNTQSPRYSTPQPTAARDSPDARFVKDIAQQMSPQELDPHIRISWTDAAVSKEGVTKFTVTIYHAAAFAEIRSLLIENSTDEENDLRPWFQTSFLRSLYRCNSWTTAGGKSGQRFFKTSDGRLILKQISKDELKTISKLAPDYAALIATGHEQNRPSALVPILGAYNVSFDNATTGKSNKFDLVVMTDLFSSYTISDKFDLKGSERNRFVKQQQQQQTDTESSDRNVLLDENLLIRSLQNPLYVHPHSKQLLLQAIAADTQFLARNSVMDYSLLVGIDTERCCIVVGIIDYLRTFTLDKKLEYVFKATGLLGGQGKAPTILYPGKYRDRFLSAMRHFFVEVPDHFLAYETHNLRLASQN